VRGVAPATALVRYNGPVTVGQDIDARLRLAMFAHLDRVSAAHPDGVPSEAINSFVFEGAPMRLIVQPLPPSC